MCIHCMCIVVCGILRNLLNIDLQLWIKCFSGNLDSFWEGEGVTVHSRQQFNYLRFRDTFIYNSDLNYDLQIKGFALKMSYDNICLKTKFNSEKWYVIVCVFFVLLKVEEGLKLD